MGIDVFIPENLDINKILLENIPSFKYDVEYFKYILGKISELGALNIDYYESNDGFVNLNAQKLQRKVRDYRKYLDYLEDYKIIWADHTYIPGEKSRGYKFSPPYQTPVKKDKITKWSLIKHHNNELENNREPQCSYLDKWIKKGLEVDYHLALEAAKRKFYSELSVKDHKAWSRYNAAMIIIDKILKGHIYFTRDSNVNRYHSILTNLGKDTRNFLTYKGQQLVSVDIKSSQPYLSCVLLSPDFYEKFKEKETYGIGNLPKKVREQLKEGKSTVKSLYDDTTTTTTYISNNKTNNISITSNIQHYLMLVESAEKPINKDFEMYKSLIQEGKLYEYILKKAPKNLKLTDRDSAKKAMFLMMFSRPEIIDHNKGAFMRFFKELFPDVFMMFEMFKLKDHALLPIILQNIESEIVINRACKKIAVERPNLFIATIHDSIVTTVGNEQYVETVLRQELINAIGFEPILVAEYWKPENSQYLGENSSFTSSGINFTESNFC